jgi:hypothetical protein
MMMSSPSDAEVIGRSLGEPEAFGLIYDRHAATLLRFLGRRAGATVAEGLVGELFRIAFERRKMFDASRASALPWLYGQQIGGDRHRGAYPGPPGHPRRTRTRRVAPSSMRGRLARPDARGIPSTSTVEMPRVTPLGFSTVIS